ncbi:hypothetical protein ACQ4PT_049622 [Festuca glaucescens]
MAEGTGAPSPSELAGGACEDLGMEGPRQKEEMEVVPSEDAGMDGSHSHVSALLSDSLQHAVGSALTDSFLSPDAVRGMDESTKVTATVEVVATSPAGPIGMDPVEDARDDQGLSGDANLPNRLGRPAGPAMELDGTATEGPICMAPLFSNTLAAAVLPPLIPAVPATPVHRRRASAAPVSARRTSNRLAVKSMVALSTIERVHRVLRKKWGLQEDGSEEIGKTEESCCSASWRSSRIRFPPWKSRWLGRCSALSIAPGAPPFTRNSVGCPSCCGLGTLLRLVAALFTMLAQLVCELARGLGQILLVLLCDFGSDGTRGGVIVAASADYFDLSTASYTLHTVSAKITMRATGKAWSITAVYGPQSDEDKMMFIEELKTLRGTVLPQWLLFGDFNLLVKESDKISRNVNRRYIAAFKAALNVLELAELRLHGRRYTWTSTCASQTQSKIDYCFASVEWRLVFPQSHMCAITTSMSDHFIMKLTGQLGVPSFKGFRFEEYWVKQKGFLETIIEAWGTPVQAGDHIRTLHIKLSRVLKVLRTWSRARVGNIKLLTAVAEQVILGLDYAQEQRELTLAEIALRQFLKQKIVGLAAISHTRIRQRSRVTWVGATHANTKLFHLKANGRRRKNFIPVIQTGSAHLTTEEDKHEELFQHFKESIGSPHRRTHTLIWEVLNIQRHDLTSLEQSFSEEELKDAVFGLPAGKAPGPDGFTSSFSRKCWPVIKGDLLLAINQLHSLRGKR